MQEHLRVQDELQNMQKPGENFPQEVSLLRQKMYAEKLLEQIKDLKQGDEITIRTEGRRMSGIPVTPHSPLLISYQNMFFDRYEYQEEDDRGVNLTATVQHEKEEDLGNTQKNYFSSHEDIQVFRGFDKRLNGETPDENGHIFLRK